jgi:hypothetical protein
MLLPRAFKRVIVRGSGSGQQEQARQYKDNGYSNFHNPFIPAALCSGTEPFFFYILRVDFLCDFIPLFRFCIEFHFEIGYSYIVYRFYISGVKRNGLICVPKAKTGNR